MTSMSRTRLTQSVTRRRSARLQQQFMAKMSRLDHTATEEFLSAIQSFDINTVEKFLKGDFQIDYLKNSNRSVLHLVVELIETGKISKSSLESAGIRENTKICLDPLKRPEGLRRIVQVLIESDRFNVNALTEYSETVLHLAVRHCKCEQFSGDAYKYLVNDIIELLLDNNANINAKSSFGRTPLMMASENGCSHIVQLLLDWNYELGAGVDLNARDILGQTVLIKATKGARVDVVELLLQHGCVDAFQDNQGCYALHAVIHGGEYSIEYGRSDFLELIGAIASEETHVNLDPNAAHSSVGNRLLIDWTRNYAIQETVKRLMTPGCAYINAKDFRGNTVLDLALKLKHRINQKTVEMLKKYGATSSAVLNKCPEYSKNTFQYTDKLGKTPFHRLFAILPNENITISEQFDFFKKHCLNSCSLQKETFEEMTLTKDHRGRTVFHNAVFPSSFDSTFKSEDILRLINVLKLKRTIKTRDKYRKIPLHYCHDKELYKSLVEQGADEHVQDVDGKTPRDLEKLRDKEHNRLILLRHKLEDQLFEEKIDVCIIWEKSEFAYRDQFSRTMSDHVQQFIDRLSDEISKKDPRFECRPVLIGSAGEETKIGFPDEFDFNFILTKFSELCEVVPSPEAPSGFVHLKRKYNDAEYFPENPHVNNQEEFNQFFNSYDFLQTTEIACRFKILYLQVLSEAKFWEEEDTFEWDPCSEVGMKYDKHKRQFESLMESKKFSIDPSFHPCSNIRLKLNRPIEGRYMFISISLDILPCIKINGWWPDEALPSIRDRIKCEGCHLVLVQPQRHYPWVPFSDPFAKISFAPAESRIIKECSAVARAAYMVGKQLLLDWPDFTYVLKTCLLYCIEALKNCTNSSLHYEDINPKELRFFAEKLMLCFNEFFLQDFLPCYMMPSFHLPIEGNLKSNHEDLLNDPDFQYPSFVHELYTQVCTNEPPAAFRPPTPEPLNENFNRDELLKKLSEWSNTKRKRRKAECEQDQSEKGLP